MTDKNKGGRVSTYKPETVTAICERLSKGEPLAQICRDEGMPHPVTIYALCDPDSQALRYIGKANDPVRRLASHLRDSRRLRTPIAVWLRQLGAEGKRPLMIVLDDDCVGWESREREFIKRARVNKHDLLNIADGGNLPCCDFQTRRKNAIRLTTGPDAGYYDYMRALGRVIREYVRVGKSAERLIAAQAFVRTLPLDKRPAIGIRWREKHGKAINQAA